MKHNQSNSAPTPHSFSPVGADEPAAKVFSPLIAVGSLFRSLFRRRPDTRWYSEEDVLADLDSCSSGAM